MATENYLLTVQGGVNGQYCENVLCFQSAGLSTTDTLVSGSDLISAWIAHIQALWLACLPSSYYISLYTARRAFPKPSAVAKVQYPAFSVPGTRGSSTTGYNLCQVCFLVPPMGVKSGGKIFMPCVPQGDLINNSKTAGYRTALFNAVGAMMTGFAGSGTNWKLGIFSRKTTAVNLAQTVTFSARIGFQGKRRKPIGSS